MTEPEHRDSIEGSVDQTFPNSNAILTKNNDSETPTPTTCEREILSHNLSHYDYQSSLQLQEFRGEDHSKDEETYVDDKGGIDDHIYRDGEYLKDVQENSPVILPGVSSISSHDHQSSSINVKACNEVADGCDENDRGDTCLDNAASTSHATLDVVVKDDGVEKEKNSIVGEDSILPHSKIQHYVVNDAKIGAENKEEPCSNHGDCREINIGEDIIQKGDTRKVTDAKNKISHDSDEAAAIAYGVADINGKQQGKNGKNEDISSVNASQEEHRGENNFNFKITNYDDELPKNGGEVNKGESAKQLMSLKRNSRSNSCSDEEEIGFNSVNTDDQNGIPFNEASAYRLSIDGRERKRKPINLSPHHLLHERESDSDDGSEEPPSKAVKRNRASENHEMGNISDDHISDQEENHDNPGEKGNEDEEEVEGCGSDRFPLKQCKLCLEWYHWRGMSRHTLGCINKIQSKSQKVESEAVAPQSQSRSSPLLLPPLPTLPQVAAPATVPPSSPRSPLRNSQQPQATQTNSRHFRKQCPQCHRWLFYQGFSSHWRSCGKGLVLGDVMTDLNDDELRSLEERKKRGYKKSKKKPASALEQSDCGAENVVTNQSQPLKLSHRQMYSSHKTHDIMGACDSSDEMENGNGDCEYSDKSNELNSVDEYMRDIHLEKDSCVQGLPFESVKKSAGYLSYIVLLNRNKVFVQPYDPRPCIGCFWCGPKVRVGDEGIIPVSMCTICKRLRELGWVRRSFNGSTRFRDENGVEYHSIKHFLSLSSKMIFSSLKGLRYVGLDQSASPPKHISLPIALLKDSNDRVESHHEAKSSESTHPENYDEQDDQSTGPDDGDEMIDGPKVPVPSNSRPEFKSLNVSKSVETMMNKRKSYVCDKDPRPCLDCDWCGPSLDGWSNAKIDCSAFDLPHDKDRLICPCCKFLKENEFWMVKHNKNTRYFWNDSRQLRVKSVKDFLVKSTKVLGKHMQDPDFSKGILEETAVWNKRVIEKAAMIAATISVKTKASKPRTKYLYASKVSSTVSDDKKLAMIPYDEPKLASTLINFAKHVHVSEKNSYEKSFVKKKYSSNGQITEREVLSSLVIVTENRQKAEKQGTATINRSNESHKMDETIEKPKIIELPNIFQLLREEEGLSGILRKDIFQVFNLNFGTNANIAAKILLSLCKGDIPSMVKEETPFVRTCFEEIKQRPGPTPGRFVGVYHGIDTTENGNIRDFSVAIPQFFVDYDSRSSKADNLHTHTPNKPYPFYKRNGYVIPRETTVKGNLLLLRAGLENETTAGKFFAFLYRILYGAKAVSDVLVDYGRHGKVLQSDGVSCTQLNAIT